MSGPRRCPYHPEPKGGGGIVAPLPPSRNWRILFVAEALEGLRGGAVLELLEEWKRLMAMILPTILD
jgi:hypothetical protein